MIKGKEVITALKKHEFGLSITDLVKKTKLTRSCIRNTVSLLIGAGKIEERTVGMAKVYTLKNEM